MIVNNIDQYASGTPFHRMISYSRIKEFNPGLSC